MDTVIPGPFIDVIFKGGTIEDHQHHSQWELRFVRFVGPQAMGTGCDAQSSDHVHEVS
jgi:hypothetical protein